MLLLALLACKDRRDQGDDSVALVPDHVEMVSGSGVSDSDGLLKIAVDVPAGARSMQLTAWSDAYVSVEQLRDPEDDRVLHWSDWYDEPRSLTDAIFPIAWDVVLDWPVREEDGPLSPGRWEVELSTTNLRGDYVGDHEVRWTAMIKSDQDLQQGKVRVRFVYAEGIREIGGVEAAVDGALARWTEVWSTVGLTPEFTIAGSDLDPALSPDSAAPFSGTVDEGGDDTDITMILGESIWGDDSETYGLAGSVPGSTLGTPRSAVYVSWLANAGGDGEFSEGDVQLFGETMAHEAGHYLGLYHPVEMSYDAWDALDDTEECGGWKGCESQLGSNLMFPYPVCDWTSCVPQGDLTDQQAGVMNLYPGAL